MFGVLPYSSMNTGSSGGGEESVMRLINMPSMRAGGQQAASAHKQWLASMASEPYAASASDPVVGAAPSDLTDYMASSYGFRK